MLRSTVGVAAGRRASRSATAGVADDDDRQLVGTDDLGVRRVGRRRSSPRGCERGWRRRGRAAGPARAAARPGRPPRRRARSPAPPSRSPRGRRSPPRRRSVRRRRRRAGSRRCRRATRPSRRLRTAVDTATSPGAATRVERRAGAVRHALLLAQHGVDARREAAADGVVGDEHRRPAVVGTGDARRRRPGSSTAVASGQSTRISCGTRLSATAARRTSADVAVARPAAEASALPCANGSIWAKSPAMTRVARVRMQVSLGEGDHVVAADRASRSRRRRQTVEPTRWSPNRAALRARPRHAADTPEPARSPAAAAISRARTRSARRSAPAPRRPSAPAPGRGESSAQTAGRRTRRATPTRARSAPQSASASAKSSAARPAAPCVRHASGQRRNPLELARLDASAARRRAATTATTYWPGQW